VNWRRRKKRSTIPEDPRIVADRERWLDMIDRATLMASLAMVEAHLRREKALVALRPPIPETVTKEEPLS
jgi:hypothetical protein